MSATGVSYLSVGWDVGGWNCDKNPKSQDALAVLGSTGRRIGKPWRGNLRERINAARSSEDFRSTILGLCGIAAIATNVPVTLAIDAPLAFPHAFLDLLRSGAQIASIGKFEENAYLFRYTERRLFRPGLKPFSAINDMIGSQATKAIHVTSRFAPAKVSTGVWSDGGALRIIETYPAACRSRMTPRFYGDRGESSREKDIADARVCARIAHQFTSAPNTLEPPTPEAPPSEGWIWLPVSAKTAPR